MAKKSTEKRVKDALWSGVGFGLGAAIFVPLFTMLLARLGLKL